MRLLLDTHVFLWFISGDNRLSGDLRQLIQDGRNEILLSVVSVWETIVKYQLGRLPLPESPHVYIPKQRARHSIDSLPLDEASVSQLASLPPLHRDPFDRMLICQAKQFSLTIVTEDPSILAYPVATTKEG